MSLSSLKFMQCGYMGSSSRDSFSSQSSTAPTSVKAEPNETSKGDKPPTDSPAHHRDTSHTTKYSFRPEFVTIPISSAASISSPFCSAAGVNCFGSPDDAKKRAAAAEARRRRRNLLAKRQTSNSPRRSLVSSMVSSFALFHPFRQDFLLTLCLTKFIFRRSGEVEELWLCHFKIQNVC